MRVVARTIQPRIKKGATYIAPSPSIRLCNQTCLNRRGFSIEMEHSLATGFCGVFGGDKVAVSLRKGKLDVGLKTGPIQFAG